MEVIDNFLPDYNFNLLQSALMGGNFRWYYNKEIVGDNDGFNEFQFINFLYRDEKNKSSFFHLLDLCISKLNIKKLHRVKVNLRPKTFFKIKSGWHIDYPDMTTSILYINTNNGFTKFKNGKKVKSVANRLVTFDSNLRHCGYSCTNKQVRVVVNFNYETT
tara:strand:- start:1046 stop:1528 length:483 start_codon:yes stop_codon:yes gene_type:complete